MEDIDRKMLRAHEKQRKNLTAIFYVLNMMEKDTSDDIVLKIPKWQS